MHNAAQHENHGGHGSHAGNHYRRLLIMGLLSFATMYVLMYAMVDRIGNAVPNWNQAYMAGLMAAPMILIELLVMRFMYTSRRLNWIVVGASLVAAIGCFVFIRKQTGIGDRQFLRSMIPHHAAALLMCEEASFEDVEIKELCRRIRQSQQSEIDEMRAILERLGR